MNAIERIPDSSAVAVYQAFFLESVADDGDLFWPNISVTLPELDEGK